ncbi:hypothetical protein BB560_006143 [Smittium megazygosporum]|uniref:Zn(2)-C6 fungal-type domain-containing protein n=1 Tax=Smittium megazygosporum TaxID=133381 RepID=A0A2T9YFT9_9FUNG|nr:hypothetical protein BB560_006143 [Smittium megazygosporum]
MACTTCRKKKIKCDGKVPTCSVCAKNNLECIYMLSRKRGRPSRNGKDQDRFPETLPLLLPKKTGSFPLSTITVKPPEKDAAITPFVSHNAINNSSYYGFSHKFSLSQEYSKDDHHVLDPHLKSDPRPLQNSFDHTQKYKNPHQPQLVDHAEHEDSESYSDLSENFPQKRVRLSGIETMAKTFSWTNSIKNVLVPSIPLPVKSKLYNEPDILQFFHYFNTQYPFVHYPSFREEFDDGTVPNYLIMAMKAVGRRYSKQPSVVLSDHVYSAGLDLMAIATSLAEIATHHDPNTSLAQTLLILSAYEFGTGKSTKAYENRNAAIRVCYKLGINLLDYQNRERRERSLITAEQCRRLWWALLYFDRIFSLISCRNSIKPIIDESLFRVNIPQKLTDYQIPSRDPFCINDVNEINRKNYEFGRYSDSEVTKWFQITSPLTLIIGHIFYQKQALIKLFNKKVLHRSTDELIMDTSWVNALSEFLRNMLVIDSEIRLLESEIEESGADDDESVLEMSHYHMKLQLYGVIIYRQSLGMYAYEKLRPHLEAISPLCTPLVWLKSSAKFSWSKISKAAESIHSIATSKYRSLSSNTAALGMQDFEWEYSVPHASFFLYLAAKVFVSFKHWTSSYLKSRLSPNLSPTNTALKNSLKPTFAYLFNVPKGAELSDADLNGVITQLQSQINSFVGVIGVCCKYWNDRDYVDLLHRLDKSPQLFTNVGDTIETILLELNEKLTLD